MQTRRHLEAADSRLTTSLQRLSSGLRINRASDDAAGLAITERMNAQIRGMGVAQRNIADGVSVVQTAESALGEISAQIQRLRTLAVSSSNDTNTASDRATLDNEAKEILDSIDQIAESTRFNGTALLDGTITNFTVQSGANNSADQRIELSLQSARSSSLGHLAMEMATNSVALAPITGSNLVINGESIVSSMTYADEIGQIPTINEQRNSAYSKAEAINASNVGVKAKVATNVVTNTFSAAGSNYSLRINGVAIFTNDQASSIEDLMNQINLHSEETGVVAQNQGTQFRLLAHDGRNINIGSNATEQGFSVGLNQNRGRLGLISDENIRIQSGGNVIGFSATDSIAVDNRNLAKNFNLSTRISSQLGIDRADAALAKVSAMRGKLGAQQNRLEITASNLSTIEENLAATTSGIRDADFMIEAANLAREQVLQQAASSILAQVNQAPNQALALIRG